MNGPWGNWDKPFIDSSLFISVEDKPSRAEAMKEARYWLRESEEDTVTRVATARRSCEWLCDGGPEGNCEGSCPKSPDDDQLAIYEFTPFHRVEHEVWVIGFRER